VEYCIKKDETLNCTQLLSSAIQKLTIILGDEPTSPPSEEPDAEDNSTVSIPTQSPDPPTVTLPQTSEATPPEEEITNWEINTMEVGDVLGTSDYNGCKFKFVKGEKEAEEINCTITPFKITDSKVFLSSNNIYVDVKGTIPTRINLSVDIYECKRELLKPWTWFNCEEQFLETKKLALFPNIHASVENNNALVSFSYFHCENNTFEAVTGEFKAINSLRFKYSYTVKDREYGISFSGGGDILINPVLPTQDGNKPFSFPLEEENGVTQWHGYTAFENPHTGIDFGAVKENVLAVSDGEVSGKGWDSYNGECNSGGNYLVIQQSNGMFTAYFHLEKSSVNIGDNVKRNQVLGVSGNTGSWNCQPLGYHLHLETRLGRQQSSHVDPVLYLNADWNNILTLGSSIYPERLTGDNPHPGK
jgi:murein DD-endopeptidase MepM/ murein hydrolase activator NlpD